MDCIFACACSNDFGSLVSFFYFCRKIVHLNERRQYQWEQLPRTRDALDCQPEQKRILKCETSYDTRTIFREIAEHAIMSMREETLASLKRFQVEYLHPHELWHSECIVNRACLMHTMRGSTRYGGCRCTYSIMFFAVFAIMHAQEYVMYE